MPQLLFKHLLFLGLFLYSSLIWKAPGGYGSGNKEQYMSKKMIKASILTYFVGMSLTYVLLCANRVPWTIAENPFTSSLDFMDLIAVIMIVFGTQLRYAAFDTLKDLFTAQVSIKENHKLVTHGPYKKIRHPSYAGFLLALIGLSILLHMSTVGYLIESLAFIGLPFRIRNEESALKEEFGKDFANYKSQTNYLIPYVI
eukprot:NODE_98_length_21025_cov_0.475055.p8 type:complete len:199 gc:universal NODE_98_length_21025_cov_0.475055:20590-19994(-)